MRLTFAPAADQLRVGIASGLFDERSRSLGTNEGPMGFYVRAPWRRPRWRVDPVNHPIPRPATRQRKGFGNAMRVSPLFVPGDPQATVLGRSAFGEPLLTIKQMEG